MTSICEKCREAGIATMIGVLILSCPIDTEKEKCPYLPPHVHIHQEIKIPSFNGMTVESNTATVVSSSSDLYHDAILFNYDDSDRPGSKIYVFNVKPD